MSVTVTDFLTAYLVTETRRYFPTATHVVVDYAGEATHLMIYYEGSARCWVCEPGSDDDWMTFEAIDDGIPSFTIPLFDEAVS